MITRRHAALGSCLWFAAPLHAAAEATPTVAVIPILPDLAAEEEVARLRDALLHEVPRLVPRTLASDTGWGYAIERAE